MKNKIFCGYNNGRLQIADWKRCLKTFSPDGSNQFVRWIICFLVLALFVLPCFLRANLLAAEKPVVSVLDDISFGGQLTHTQANFIIQGILKGLVPSEKEPPLIFSVHDVVSIESTPTNTVQNISRNVRLLQGNLKELVFEARGDGEIVKVQGDWIEHWSVRRDSKGSRFLVVKTYEEPKKTSPTNLTFTITTSNRYDSLPYSFIPLTFSPTNSALFEGELELTSHNSLELTFTNLQGLSQTLLDSSSATQQPIKFRFSGSDYSLTLLLREKDPDARKIELKNFSLVGELKNQSAIFTLKGEAVVKHLQGGSLMILGGNAALIDLPANSNTKYESNKYWQVFNKSGAYPIELKFNAKVSSQDGWNSIDFEVMPSVLRPIILKGLTSDSQIQIVGAKPQRQGEDYISYAPSDGAIRMRWKEKPAEEVGKLFFSIDGAEQISVGAGLMRQLYVLEYKILQGELTRLEFEMEGEGEITRIRGDDILAWKTEESNQTKRVIVQLNQPKKEKYTIAIQTQTPLGVFPITVKPMRLTPLNAVRCGGSLQVVNDGAVKLEVTEASGLSQISPELFPIVKEISELGVQQFTQTFAYRFSGVDYSLTIQADHILPELTISELLLYLVGETEMAIEAELEIDIREAPLREFTLQVPSGYNVSRINMEQLADYFLTPLADSQLSQLRLVFSKPLSGRQIVQLRLEKNQPASVGVYSLPKIQPLGTKTIRGNVGVAAETGFRLTSSRISGLTEIAPAYFPKKVPGLQLAWRLREEQWDSAINIERLSLALVADVVHIFTATEGIIYGSSIINFFVSGTPVSSFKLNVPPEYSNIEFTGRDVRNWKKNGNEYEVFLHSPVFGAYTLLATFDRQFDVKSNLVSCIGVSPVDSQSERGSVILVSEYQFEVSPEKISPGVIHLDPVEVPPDQRLLFTAPILDAYQYSSRPFDLALRFKSFALGQTVRQVVDRAQLKTRISAEGELVTEGRYFVKTHGHTHLSFESAPDIQLWETYVNDQKVIPVSNDRQILIPLPSKGGPLMVVDLKWASKSKDKKRISLTTPALDVPILLTEWQISPDKNYRLKYVGGTIKPVSESSFSGFEGLAKLMRADQGKYIILLLCLIGLAAVLYAIAASKTTDSGWIKWLFLRGAMVLSIISMLFLFILIILPINGSISFERALSFLAPVQDAGNAISLQIENTNIGKEGLPVSTLLLGLFGIGLWIVSKIYNLEGFLKKLCIIGGWFLLFWGAMILTNGISVSCGLMMVFVVVHIIIPLAKLHSEISKNKTAQPQQPSPGGLVTLFVASLIAAFSIGDSDCAEPKKSENVVLNLNQQARVQDNYVTVQAQMKWKAETGARLDFLSFPAILMKIEYQQQEIDHSAVTVDGKTFNRLIARQNGEFDIKFTYQTIYRKDGSANSFVLPTPAALVNKFELELERLDQEVFSPDAVSIDNGKVKRGEIEVTRATVIFEPRSDLTIGWRPRQRDVKSEKPLFYAELYHLFIPMPGVLEVVSQTDIRPAQGELDEITFTVPQPITITDVQADFVSSWKFDPDKRILRVQFRSAQSKPFNFIVRSQTITTSLPYTVTNNFISVEQSAGQVGMAAVATGNEVQLDTVNDGGLSLINLEDFPSKMVSAMTNQIPGLALRRAFRYSHQNAAIVISVSAVKPDIRAESQETLSIGEDRILLASQLNFTVARAGIFKLSFVLPRDYEVESISGDVLSHWTEMKSGNDRIITIHLRSKTEGSHTLNITLTGQGIGTRKEFEAPRLVLREAEKHSGQLLIVSELGIRLHIKTRNGLTQLDPLKSGIKQKGVQVFRILHPRWQLVADIESVEPLITVNSLLDVSIREGAVMNNVTLDYQIENAGVKTFKIKMPAAAENARFEGELISDFVKNQTQGQWSEWEVKLQRRVIGSYSLNIIYQIPLTNQQTLKILGVKAINANLQRGNLALRAGGRIELKVPSLPPGLQRAEWENIPQSLRKRETSETKDTFSALENDFELPITISRHEIAKVIPARIESLELLSVISSSGEMLTEGKLSIFPGDKRLLRIKLPESSKFWYAFVNGESAWPWLEKDEILIMLEKNSDPQKPSLVEFFYSLPQVSDKSDKVIKNLRGPSFDLPLQNVTWNINFPSEWNIKNWESSLQLSVPPYAFTPKQIASSDYLQNEVERIRQQSKQAESLIVKGNALIQKGAPQQARRAFQAAQNIAQQDAALNEDARVQLHNLKMQQALIGLNQRQQAVVETPDKKKQQLFSQWTPGKEPDYTQQQAKQVLEQSPADENVTLAKLAERLIRQQEAAVGKPVAIRPTLPELGARIAFSVPLKVEPWSDLSIKLKTATQLTTESANRNIAILATMLCFIAFVLIVVRKPQK